MPPAEQGNPGRLSVDAAGCFGGVLGGHAVRRYSPA